MKRMLQLGCWTTALMVVIVVTIEATVRVDDWAQYDTPVFDPSIAMGELFVQDSVGAHARANTHYRRFRVNNLGMRGSDISDVTLSAGQVVVTSGASETFGLYERQGGEWPQQLRDKLDRHCNSPVIVLNSAFAGMTMPTVQQDLRNRVRPLHPRLVVYYPTPMQYLGSSLPHATEPSKVTPTRLSPWRSRAAPRITEAINQQIWWPLNEAVSASPVAGMLRLIKGKIVMKLPVVAPARTATFPSDRLDAYELDLRKLIGEARSQGMQIALVQHSHRFRDTLSVQDRKWLRSWEFFYPTVTGQVLITFSDSAAMRGRQVALDSTIILVDPRPALRLLGDSAFHDFSHFTDLGASTVGSVVADAVAPSLCPPPTKSAAGRPEGPA